MEVPLTARRSKCQAGFDVMTTTSITKAGKLRNRRLEAERQAKKKSAYNAHIESVRNHQEVPPLHVKGQTRDWPSLHHPLKRRPNATSLQSKGQTIPVSTHPSSLVRSSHGQHTDKRTRAEGSLF